MNFGSWDSSVHDNYEQISRIATGVTKVRPHSISKSDLSAEFIGSSGDIYNTSLDVCNCMDFSTRRLPCKHIYSLANELGYLHELPNLNKDAARSYDYESDIEKYIKLYRNGIISVEKLSRIAKALEKGL
jgi:hypothetical protein